MSGLLSFFGDMKISATPVFVVHGKDAKGQKTKTPTNGTPIKGLFHTPSKAAVYFGNRWSEDISGVFTTEDIAGLTNKDKLTVSSITYDIDSIEDPGSMNVSGWDNVYLIALKAIQ